MKTLYGLTRWSLIWITSFCFVYGGEKSPCDSGFAVISHKLALEINPETASFSCVDTIVFRRFADVSGIICLRILPRATLTQLTDGRKPVSYRREHDRVFIDRVPDEEEFVFVASFKAALRDGSEFSKITQTAAIVRLDEILPSGNAQYESVRISVMVPSGWKSVGPGNMVSETDDGIRCFSIWEFNKPLPMLGWVCAGAYHKSESADRGIVLSTYLTEEDSVGASKVRSLSGQIIRFYGDKFTPYRFKRLSIVEVDNWLAGKNVLAVASPGFVMVKRFAFTTDDSFNRVESILAHEIAHEWWPLTVFLSEDDLPFLSEGLCEHSARWFNRSRGKESGRDSLGAHPLLRPLLLRILLKEETPLGRKTDMRNSQTHYLKGAYVHHMLCRLVGEDRSEILYKLFSERFKEKKAGIGDFTALAESLAGRNLSWFFDQWLNRTDIPQLKIYNVKTKLNGDAWITDGRIRVVGYQKFTITTTVFADDGGGGGWDTVTVGIDETGRYRNDAPFRIITIKKPSALLLDPFDDILKNRKMPPKLADLREVSDGVMIIGTLKNAGMLRAHAEKDSADMALAGWNLEIVADSSATLSHLQRRRVFVYGKPDENLFAGSIGEKFPYRFSGDSLFIKDQAVADNLLSFYQVIDNPYIQHGLLVWIAHLGADAGAKLLPYDASWILLNGKYEIEKGVWEVADENLRVDIP